MMPGPWRHGLYTEYLLKAMQEPWMEGGIEGDFFAAKQHGSVQA